jgi:hypothetical protein
MTLLLVALLTASAVVDDAAFKEGAKLYDALDYDRALVKFQDAAKRATTSGDKATAALWIGLASAGAGDLDTAAQQFELALRLDRTLQLPKNTSPTLVARFEEIRQALAKEQPAPLVQEKPPEPPPSTSPAPNILVIGGAVTAGLGALALVGGGVMTALIFVDLGKANDKSSFPDDARKANAAAGSDATVALVLFPVGVVVGGAGAALVAAGLE